MDINQVKDEMKAWKGYVDKIYFESLDRTDEKIKLVQKNLEETIRKEAIILPRNELTFILENMGYIVRFSSQKDAAGLAAHGVSNYVTFGISIYAFGEKLNTGKLNRIVKEVLDEEIKFEEINQKVNFQ